MFVCVIRISGAVAWLFVRKLALLVHTKEAERKRTELSRELAVKRDFYDSSLRRVHNSLQTFLIPLELMLTTPSGSQTSRDRDVELGKISRLTGRIILAQIANVLDLRRINNNTLVLNVKPENLRERVTETYALFQVLARARSVTLTLAMDPGIPDFVLCDSTRFSQVLVSLLVRSLNGSRRGEVQVRLDWQEDSAAMMAMSFQGLDAAQNMGKDMRSSTSIDGMGFMCGLGVEMIAPQILPRPLETHKKTELDSGADTERKDPVASPPQRREEKATPSSPTTRPRGRLLSQQNTGAPSQGLLTVHIVDPAPGTDCYRGESAKAETWVLDSIVRLTGGGPLRSARENGRNDVSFAVPLVVASSQAVDERSLDSRTQSDGGFRFAGQKVLYVEAQECNRTKVKCLLEEAGLVVKTCRDGREGLQTFKEHAGTAEAFSCVITGLRMQIMSGTEMAQEIAAFSIARGIPSPHTIALTGASLVGLKPPLSRVLRKPATRSALLGAVRAEICTETSASIKMERVDREHEKRTILVVEDDPVASRIAEHCLRKLCQKTAVAAGVQDAVGYYMRNHGEVALVLQDSMMADGSGVDCVRAIRMFEQKQKVVPNVTIVSISGVSVDQQKEEYAGLGVADYFSKPLGMGDLALIVSRFV